MLGMEHNITQSVEHALETLYGLKAYYYKTLNTKCPTQVNPYQLFINYLIFT